jgi:pimeloyl-ACP methyl ester carboxylesterase
LFDLLTPDEAAVDDATGHLRFDIGFLATRLVDVTDWLGTQDVLSRLPVGYFGASTGAAAALVAAADRPEVVRAVVSRGGRPDLAMAALERVRAPTLLIVGAVDYDVIPLNESAYRRLRSPKELVLVDRATHLFEEPGAMEQVARLAAEWFDRHLSSMTMVAR